MKPIPDKAEIVLEYPDKFYSGTFERSSRFETHWEQTGISLALYHDGDENVRKSVRMHVHYALFAEILSDLAKTVSAMPLDEPHREALGHAAKALNAALSPRRPALENADRGDEEMTAAEEVSLLHIME